MTTMPIYLRVREFRESLGLTQAQLAEASGVRQATISAMERGVKAVYFDQLERVAKALGLDDPRELLEVIPGKGEGE